MKNNKLLFITAAVLLLLAMFTACDGDKTIDATPTATPTPTTTPTPAVDSRLDGYEAVPLYDVDFLARKESMNWFTDEMITGHI